MFRLMTGARPRHHWMTLVLWALVFLGANRANVAQPAEETKAAPSQETASFPWIRSPHIIKFKDDYARIDVPAGVKCRFMKEEGALAYVQDASKDLAQKLAGVAIPFSGSEIDPAWRMVFSYDQIGYVNTDNVVLDADELLDRFQKGLVNINDRRRLTGKPEIERFAWAAPPTYDASRQELRWAVRSIIPGGDNISLGVCRLGRHGVMKIVVDTPSEKDFEAHRKDIEGIIGGFQFTGSSRYEAFEAGDKVAAKALQDLVIGPVVASRWASLKAFLTSAGGLALIVGGSVLFLAAIVGAVVWIARKKKTTPAVP